MTEDGETKSPVGHYSSHGNYGSQGTPGQSGSVEDATTNGGVARRLESAQSQRIRQRFLFSLQPNSSIRPGLIYGCVFVWLSIVGGRFMAPFLEHQVDMTPEMIGLCLATQFAIVTMGGSIVGPWADERELQFPGRGRMQMITLGIAMGTVFFLLHSLPHLVDSESSDKTQVGPSLWMTVYVFLLRIGYASSLCCILPVLDAVTLKYLEQHPHKSRGDYGRERLFGAVGWAIAHFGYGVLADRVGFQATYPCALLAAVALLVAISVFTRQQIQQSEDFSKRSDIINEDILDAAQESSSSQVSDQEQQKEGWASRLNQMLRLFFGTYYSTCFMLCFFILSAGQAVVNSLIFLYLETLESSYTLMGITVLFTVAFEIPIFQIAPTLLEHSNSGVLLLVACISYAIRVLGYASIPKQYVVFVLALEPLHGVCYACSQTSAVDMAAESSPPGWEATGQGLISLIRGLGAFSGLLYGGWAVQHLGGRQMYVLISYMVLFGALCFGAAYWFQSPLQTSSRTGRGPQYNGLGLEKHDDDGREVVHQEGDARSQDALVSEGTQLLRNHAGELGDSRRSLA